jgi:hypothetical protein
MALFNNKTKWVIYLFVATFIAALAWHSSRAAESSLTDFSKKSLTVSAGSTVIRGPAPVIDMDWRWKATQSEDANWEAGITMYGSSTYNGKEQPNNFFPYVRYVDGFGKMDIGLGLCYLQNTDLYNGSKMNFSLMLGYRVKKWVVKYQHTSNAGSVPPNLGRDFVLLGREM